MEQETIVFKIRTLDKRAHALLKIEAIKQKTTLEELIKKVLFDYAENIGD